MKYLIISNYDSQCTFSICDNGRTYTAEDKMPNFIINIKRLNLNLLYDEFVNAILCMKELEDYDFIVYCEDGYVEILKDKMNDKEEQK